MATGPRKRRNSSGVSDKERWKEIELKMKFNSCDEATTFWQSDWTECPVCGARIEPIAPLDNDADFTLVHKDQFFLFN